MSNGISTISNRGVQAYDLKELVVDTATDLENLPTDIATGSTAFCIETAELFMLNSKKEWRKI